MIWQTEKDAGNDVLEKIEQISNVANSAANEQYASRPVDFHSPEHAQRDLEEKKREKEGFSQLAKEPLLAAVLTETNDGESRVYYFARRVQIDGVDKYFTHSMAPIGGLATYEPGDEYTLPSGEAITVISKYLLSPKQEKSIWDSRPTLSYWSDEEPKTITSLRSLVSFERSSIDGWELLDEATEAPKSSSRDALRGTGLRDQAILDKIQDEIFRLPLSSQLMISGPPGSGKTTTLIKRMAQKNELSFLSQKEKTLVEQASLNGRAHSESWIMFTPTELLEGYLSEAFNREGVPAPKERVWTWAKFSLDFGREEARILRKSNNRSGFTIDETARHLTQGVHKFPGEWLQRFEEWLANDHLNELKNANEKLLVVNHPDLDLLSFQIGRLLPEGIVNNLFTVFENLASLSEGLGRWSKSTRDKWRDLMDRRIDRFGRLDEPNIKKLDALVTEFERISKSALSDEELLDEDDEHEIEEKPTTQSRKDRVFAVVRQSLNAGARGKFSKRRASQRYSDLLAFIGDEILDEDQIVELGRDLEAISGASRILRANNAYFNTMATRYRSFRKLEMAWYSVRDINRDRIDRDELDALILMKLKAVRAIVPRVQIEDAFWSSLRPFAEKLRNQVYVDEATDFSEMQLAAMYHLAHPQLRSFFISGDFDQRLTEWGVKDDKSLQRAVPGITIREVEVGYRQSKKLKSFVDVMRRRWFRSEQNSMLPKIGQYEGFGPAMFEAEGDLDAQARWIAERIHEVDSNHDRLPSIAILVPRPEDVKPLVKKLEGLLDSIPVSAHEEAGHLGRDEEVRVFPIHHVKGLEFEAAFFVGVDQLQLDVPNLFHRYLYVGSTRAATFLGFAANNKMPAEIIDMRDMFVSSWSS